MSGSRGTLLGPDSGLTDSHCWANRRHTSSDQTPLFRRELTVGLTRTQNSPNSRGVEKLKFSCFTFLFVN